MLENIVAVSYNLKYSLTIDLAIPILGIYQSDMTNYGRTKTYTELFMVVLFIISKN